MAFEIPMSLFGVLWAGEWVPSNDLIRMSEDDMRNALIAALRDYTRDYTMRGNIRYVNYLQKLDNDNLVGKGAILTFLRLASQLSGSVTRTMTDGDQRNYLIRWNNKYSGIPIPDLQAMNDKKLVLTGLNSFRASIPQTKPQIGPLEIPMSLNGVLWAAKMLTLNDLFRMMPTEEDKRNTLIRMLSSNTSQPVNYFQGFDTNTLVMKGAIALFLKKANILSENGLRRMSDDDQRNALIVENNRKTDISISKLQAMSDKELVLTGLTWLEGSGMQGMQGRAQGKAIFKRDPSRDSVGKNRDWQGGDSNDLVTIDYPSHVLFQSARTFSSLGTGSSAVLETFRTVKK